MSLYLHLEEGSDTLYRVSWKPWVKRAAAHHGGLGRCLYLHGFHDSAPGQMPTASDLYFQTDLHKTAASFKMSHSAYHAVPLVWFILSLTVWRNLGGSPMLATFPTAPLKLRKSLQLSLWSSLCLPLFHMLLFHWACGTSGQTLLRPEGKERGQVRAAAAHDGWTGNWAGWLRLIFSSCSSAISHQSVMETNAPPSFPDNTCAVTESPATQGTHQRPMSWVWLTDGICLALCFKAVF